MMPRVTQQTDIGVATAEHVRLMYPIAGIGNRFLAAFLDAIIQTLLLVGLPLITIPLGQSGLLENELVAATFAAILVLVMFFLLWGYFVVFETMWNGQTPGKRYVGIRVIRDDGSAAGFVPILIRNLVRVVDFLPLFYAIGAFSMVVSSRGQRLGDLVAGTIVVKARVERDFRRLQTRATASERIVSVRALPGEAQRIVREFALREASLAPEARAALARSLSGRIRPLVPESIEIEDDVVFLRAVAASLRAQGERPADGLPPSR